MLDRKEILNKAIHDCFKEMYAKAQPSADWDQIIKEYETGVRGKDERVYEQHYLSQEEYTYILEKYLDAYNIRTQWKEDVEIVEEYLNDGGLKDKYIKDHTDKNGDFHPGYRSTEKVPPIKTQILKYLDKYNKSSENEEIATALHKIVMKTISECKNFYHFDREESSFRMTVALGASPCTNAETVKQYWKEKTGEDIVIEERNPKLFWYQDMGYDDEDMAYEFDDPNWKETLDKEWKDELEKKAQERNKRLKKLEEKIQKENKDA